MAPSDKKDGAEKYAHMSLDELQKECRERDIEFQENTDKDGLIALLLKDDNKGPDWAEVFADLLCHTSLDYEGILRRTIPQIEAIRSRLGKNISLKIGMPGLFGGALEKPIQENDGKPPKLSEFMAFASAFDVIK